MSHLQQADQMEQRIADGSAGDDKLHVQFYRFAVHDPEASLLAQRPIYRDADFIRIMKPGDRDNIEREVRDYPEYSDKMRFPKQWDAYQRKVSQDDASGTPLAAWPVVTESQRAELAFFGCKTVEQLAGMSDANAAKFMGANALRQRAKEFLEAAKSAEPLAAVRVELAKRDEALAGMQAQLAEMAKQLAESKQQKHSK